MTDLFIQKRLRRLSDKDKVFDTLSMNKNARYGFFPQMTDVFVFALALGLKNRKRSELIGEKSEPIHVDAFKDNHLKFFDMVALYDAAGRLESLDKSSDEKVLEMQKAIEEYANGGLEILIREIEIHPENAFNIVTLLINKELKEGIPSEVLEDISWN